MTADLNMEKLKTEEEEKEEEKEGDNNTMAAAVAGMKRKEKRKAMKKMKRKQMRKEMAEKQREEEEARSNDPEEEERMRKMEEEEARRRERELKEFEERERAWFEAMEMKKKKEEEEEREEEEKRRKDLEESRRQQVDDENQCKEDDEWEYVEEGPAEIIFQGNEIIFRKKKVKVPKKHVNQTGEKEVADRPISNPLPPQSAAFADHQTACSAEQALENVAQQVPNFGTEQDKAHCPFHLKTGACRFGERCSRVHFYPDKSCTLLMKNLYTGPGLAWEQDEGLEYTDEEIEHCYEEFYEDVHTEFLKFGEIVNFKVCKNGSFHLRGNVYVHYKSLESAVLAYQFINGRYFAGKQVKCEFVSVTKWKAAICGEYMKSRLKTCSHGTACNFIHCFRNPGGDYEWADWEKPPPRYWMKKMAALFGYSDEYDKQMEYDHLGKLKNSCQVISTDSHRRHSRRSRSKDADHRNSGYGPSRSHGSYSHDRGRTHEYRLSRSKDYSRSEHSSRSSDSGGSTDRDIERERDRNCCYSRRSSKRESKWSKSFPDYGVIEKRNHETYSDDNSSDRDKDREMHSCYRRESLRSHGRQGSEDLKNHEDEEKERKKHCCHSLRQHSRQGSPADHWDRNENLNPDLIPERSDGDGEKHRPHRHERKGSEQHDKVTGSPDCYGYSQKRTHNIDSTGEWSHDNTNETRHRWHEIKSLQNHNDVSEASDYRGNSKMRARYNTDEYRSDRDRERDKSRHQHRKRSSGRRDNSLESHDDHKNSMQQNCDTDSDKESSDREKQRKRHHHHRRKRSRYHHKGSDNRFDGDRESHNHESRSVDGYEGTYESQVDDSTDLASRSEENIDKLGRWKPEVPEA